MRETLREAHTWFLRTTHSHPKMMVSGLAAGTIVFFVLGVQVFDAFLPPDNVDFDINKMTIEEAKVAAMVENSRTSSWKENLNNALEAQDQFMLPGAKFNNKPKFMDKVEKRSLEIMKSQHDWIDRENEEKHERFVRENEEKKKETTKIWV
eukprot:CAMPEP_0198144152 /NCGR_PEP_ID=MMETSP1443-20131203/13606_1 /TAXON_ID=186043 /ORGANISM="Entomoneis sp., Strain CCMP2396" /LENGTH=150 /DNA_ID=CAMNT_0043807503 /DNA_START=141 /DNA_END=593 /DNA_ORIENTATION=+